MTNPSNDSSFFEKAGQWLSHSITLRLFVIGILILIMLIPVGMIESLIRERQYRQTEAQNEVSEKWGYPQTVGGLVLSVPYTVYSKVTRDNGQEEMMTSTAYYHILPESLNIGGDLVTEKRNRGIFETIVYSSELELTGQFNLEPDQRYNTSGLRWEEATVSLGITDLRSIQESVSVNWEGQSKSFNPGLPTQDVFQSGISVPVAVEWEESATTLDIPFSVDLSLRGSDYIRFVPLGKTTTVEMRSGWNSPSFDGAFLPQDREVNTDGFSANWKVLNLNRPYPQEFNGSVHGINESAFGVTLLLPVDHYQKSTRAAKYAVLFITLTFVVFFFIQIMGRVRIHPVQYILVGFALCMFYTLLISISEHLLFGWAYLIAAGSIVSLVSFYAHGTFKSTRLTGVLAAIMTLLYGFIFTIIQLQDLALLVGSIGLFLALAVIMYITRKIDWYNSATFTQKRKPPVIE